MTTTQVETEYLVDKDTSGVYLHKLHPYRVGSHFETFKMADKTCV